MVRKAMDSDFSDSDVDMDTPFRPRVPIETPAINLLSFLPPDTWMKLSPAERASLQRDLPDIGGWWGLSTDDAASENMRQLLLGANMSFGNPLMRFRFPDAARRARINAERSEFEWQRKEFAASVTASILTHRAQLLRTPMARDEHALVVSVRLYPFLCSKSRFFPQTPPVDIDRGIIDEVRTTAPSLFLAIQAALASAPTPLTAAQMLAALPCSWAPALDAVDVPSMTPLMYLECALQFLAQPIVNAELATAAQGWASPFVRHDAVTDSYVWLPRSDDDELAASVRLMHLERLFRAPFHDEDPSMAPLRSLARVAHTHLSAPKRHCDDVGITNARPAFKVKSSEKTLAPCTFSKEAYQAQDRQRYAQPGHPYTYHNPDTGARSVVGPLLPVDGSLVNHEAAALLVVVPELLPPSAVGWLNITRDALARLPRHGGSRADVVALAALSMSAPRFATGAHGAVAVARTLDFLSTGSLACASFALHPETQSYRWVYSPPRA
ncbi:hypothetical protein ACHHYP_08970 [Achlya hypogyna]|uniref:Nuclear factor related to kappa-B-binding protein second winged helix domain-containing protein n=1 Tax=Achlya hypogyna TaxID=1202772 RepID=A0A1V9YNX0_ACHHY|nr:hypothetical protein ACHHYP_08970 [Achlya hypogyna]